jgi:hypothetical protein
MMETVCFAETSASPDEFTWCRNPEGDDHQVVQLAAAEFIEFYGVFRSDC